MGFSLRKLGQETVETLSNRSWLMLFAAGLVFALYVGLHSNTDRYYDLYFWQWTPEHVQIFPVVHMFIAISCGLLAYPLTRGRDKKRTAIGLFLAVSHAGSVAGRAAPARPAWCPSRCFRPTEPTYCGGCSCCTARSSCHWW